MGIIRRLVVGCAAMLLFSFVTGCSPARVRFSPGEIPVAVPPTTEEQAIGVQARAQLLKEAQLNNEPRYVKRAAHVLERILGATPSSDHWKVYIVSVDAWNAMTTPGNHIYVFTGLMDSLKDDDELAAVLAHEISHRLARHHIAGEDKQLGELLTILAGVAVAATVASDETSTPQDVQDAANLTANLMKGIAVNPYDQAEEYEADLIGLFLMADAGFNPTKAARVWYNMAQSRPGEAAMAFFSTHPPSEDRYNFLMQHMPLAGVRYRAALERKSQLLKADRRKVDVIHEPNQFAESRFQQGAARFREYQFDAAASDLRAAIRADRQYLEPRILLGLAQVKLGDLLGARKTYQSALQVAPRNATVHYNLGCIHALNGEKQQALLRLSRAFTYDPSLKGHARSDPDLFSLKDDPEFQALLQGSGGATFQINAP